MRMFPAHRHRWTGYADLSFCFGALFSQPVWELVLKFLLEYFAVTRVRAKNPAEDKNC